MIDAAPLHIPTGVVHPDAPASMDYKIREAWCEALVNPKYTQGYHFLCQRTTGGLAFDALGVLTDVAVQAEVTVWEGLGADPVYFHTPGGNSNRLSNTVYEWAGFKGMHPSQPVPLYWAGALHPVWRLNDRFKIPFAQIAEMIQAQY